MPTPLISVVIPVFNGEAYLGQALDSVVAQTYRSIEILVVDDGSTDGSAEVARRYPDPRIHLVSQPNGGPADARNHGVRLARGDFVAFLDADDLWEPRKLELQLDGLHCHPGVAMAFGELIQVRPGPEGSVSGLEPCGAPMPGHSVGTLLIRTEAFRRVGPFDTRWRVGEFLDWYTRALDLGFQEIMVSCVVLRRRLHRDNLCVRQRAARQDYAKILVAAVARRRQARTQDR